MAYVTVTDAVGVEYTLNTDNIVWLRNVKNIQEVLFVDGSKINLKPEDAPKLKSVLSS
jgi:hypothetical protein